MGEGLACFCFLDWLAGVFLSPRMTPPSAQTPPEAAAPTLRRPSTAAAGLTAVLKTTSHTLGLAGVVAGTRALLKVNQLDGFDCQSCAWPSHDADRHVFDDCENGAKAVTDETMKHKEHSANF